MVKLMTVRSVAKEFGLSENMLRTWIKKGECPGFYAGNRFMINVDLLEDKMQEDSDNRNERVT